MNLNKVEILEIRVSKNYTVDKKSFTPEVVYRDGKFHHFTAHNEMGHKVKFDFKLDVEDEEVFNILKDFFKSI